jgi:hypothetical protein
LFIAYPQALSQSKEACMAQDARTTLVGELLSEFIEDRVRQAPQQAFGMWDVKQSLAGMLGDAGMLIELRPADERWISASLDRHPLLLRQSVSAATWKPGLNKGAVAHA